ncbi:MAG: hypothetical protein AAF519_07840 [Bacteroidota bacterium]
MKKSNYILLFTLFLTFNLIQAQDEERESKFSLIGYGGFGYGTMDNDTEPNYNLNVGSAELLLTYNLNKRFGIATGIGMNELTGNGFNSIGNFYQERTLLKIPLLLSLGPSISEKFDSFVNLGFYGQNIIKDEYRFLDNTQEDIYEGWNFGAQLGVGILFKLADSYYSGINFQWQSDLSKFESSNTAGINDEQRMNNLNSVGILFMIKL